jgi:hypothetical protein
VGFLRDLTGAQPFGVEVVSLVVSAHLLDLLARKVERVSWVMRLVTSFIFLISYSFFLMILSSFLTGTNRFSGYPVLASLGMALATAVLLPVFFYVTSYFFRDRLPLRQYELFG